MQSETDSDETRRDRNQTSQIRARSELTIEAKTATGFRIAYVNRELKMSGTAPAVQIAGPAFEALTGIVIRATTDAGGRPIQVDNVEEVQAQMKVVIERMVAAFQDKPKIQALMQQMMSRLLLVDGKEAARTYMEELPLLAVGQNTGLKLGETRRQSEQIPNPLGGGTITSNITLRIADADARHGKVKLAFTRNLDPDALKTVIADLVTQMGAAADKPFPPAVLEVLKSMTVSVDSQADFQIEDGMTRSIREQTVSTGNAMGQSFSKRERKLVTVTPAP